MDYESDLIVSFSGLAEAVVSYDYLADGGIVASGLAQVDPGFFDLTGDGGFFFTGGANVFVDTAFFLYDAGGAFVPFGQSDQGFSTSNIDVEGTFVFGGSALVLANYEDEFDFYWRTRRIQTDEFDFYWHTGARPYNWYRVTGGMGPRQCPPEGYQPGFVLNILARNVGDVCQKLIDRHFPGRIRRIEQFTIPAFESAWDDTTNPDCNRLIDVTPTLASLDCVDLLIDALPMQRIGWVGLFLPVYEVVTTGSLGTITGRATQRLKSATSFAGSFSISGSSVDIVATAWSHEPEGGFEVLGEVAGDGTNTVVLEDWSFGPTGGIVMDGESAIEFDEWAWDALGGISFSGVCLSVQGFNRTSDGVVPLSGSADLQISVVHLADGTISLDGEAFTAFPEHVYEGSGEFVLDGIVETANSVYEVEADGGLFFNGGDPFVFLGGPALDGDAEAFIEVFADSDGGPAIEGEADVESSLKEMTGGFGFSGVARAYTDDLGTFVSTVAWNAAVSETRYVFRFQDAAEFSTDTARILSRCCVNTLPSIISVDHRLDQTAVFGQFLARNGLEIPTRVDIRYNRAIDMWHQTLHFSGYAAAYPLTESWDVTFSLKCLGRVEGAAVTNTFMEFGVVVKQHGSDGRERVHRFRVQYLPDTFCPATRSLLNFSFVTDVRAVAVSPVSEGDLVLQDEIGLYRGRTYDRNPRVRFKLSDNAVDPVQGTVDIGPAIASALAAV